MSGVSKQIEEALAKSAAFDIPSLFNAKEKARKAMNADPSTANISAFDKASRLLEAAKAANGAESAEPVSIPDYKGVLEYVAEAGRKLAKSKLYDDVRRGRLKKQSDGSYRIRDVDRYILSLPLSGTPDGLTEKVADRQRRKEEADIRKAEAQAKREEFNLAVAQGRYLPREQIAMELAVRAVALRDALKNAVESSASDIFDLVSGDTSRIDVFIEFMGRMFDRTMGDYSRPLDITLEISGVPDAEEVEDVE